MSKAKSAVCFVIITIVLAVLCVWCTVSFPAGVNNVHSVISTIKKDSTLGGSYTAVYYPEGVISTEMYELNADGSADYASRYVKKGSVYLEKETAIDEDTGDVSAQFKENFANDVKAIVERCDAYAVPGMRVDVVDTYTARVTVPAYLEDAESLFAVFAYMGEVTVQAGDKVIMYGDDEMAITDYITGFSTQVFDGVYYVNIHFTEEGRAAMETATASASDTAVTIKVMVGENAVMNFSTGETINLATLPISGSYTDQSSRAIATVLQNALTGTQTELVMRAGDMQLVEAVNGENTMLFVYIGLGAFLLLSAAFFFVRYHALGLVHLYALLTYAVVMAMCLAFIPFVQLGIAGIIAIVATMMLLNVGNAVVFESIKKQFELGKTMSASVKAGYKKCLWGLFDLHIVLAAAAALVFAIALTELQAFAFVFMLGALLSGICTLGLTRFYWYITMALAGKKDKFCNFKREEVEDDE